MHIDVIMTSRDHSQLHDLLDADLQKITKNFHAMNETEKKFLLGRIQENVQKIEKYLVKEVKNIGNGK